MGKEGLFRNGCWSRTKKNEFRPYSCQTQNMNSKLNTVVSIKTKTMKLLGEELRGDEAMSSLM